MNDFRRALGQSTLLLALVGVGCKLEVESAEDQRGNQADDADATAAKGGSATGSGGSSNQDDDEPAAGSSAMEDPGVGGAGGEPPITSTTSLVEDCDTDVAGSNDDVEHAVELGSSATLCLKAGDQDFVYIDAPPGKKASIARVLIAPDAGVSADFTALAAADGSTLGSSYTSGGADVNLAMVLAPGSRTYLALKPWVAGGTVVLTSSLEAEQDDFEPNNEKSQAAPIEVNTDVEAQFHSAYASNADSSAHDWYEATLGAGPHTLRLIHVPDDIRLELTVYDPKGASLGGGYARSNGEIFDYEFTAATAGIYQLELRFFVGAPPAFAIGKEPASIADTYTFRIDE